MLRTLDAHFGDIPARPELSGLRRALVEFLYFGVKQVRACLFVGLFFAAVFLVPRAGLFGVPRYDLLLVIAIAIQGWMLRAGLETWDELKAITLFHLIGLCLELFKTSPAIGSWSFGLCLELFKTSPAIGSWSYPDFAYTKLFGVPLFSGFMYAAVGSYIIQAWRLFDLRIHHHPPYWMAWALAIVIYANFFTHHFIGDYRWYLAACALGLYARTRVVFRPYDHDRSMPLLVSFVLIGFFIWLAENVSTFFSIWRYPDQLGAWTAVHWSKWSSWSLLVVMTFTIVANLKHIKERVHVPA
jgi:uncharacterized membrane protein YoaT (DUF817 family)